MAFTYQLPFVTDRDRVRFHVADTDPNAPRFTDAELDAVLIEAGTCQRAVIACLQHLIAQLSVPSYRADWLSIDPSAARQGYERLLREKRALFGLSAVTGGAVHVSRADTEEGSSS